MVTGGNIFGHEIGDKDMKIPFMKIQPSEFGSCCKDLKDAMALPPNSLFRVSEWGVLYMTVGYARSDEGLGWMDQAVIFCPFCGKRLQSRDEIRLKALDAPTIPQ
jgi:hypothetical protein